LAIVVGKRRISVRGNDGAILAGQLDTWLYDSKKDVATLCSLDTLKKLYPLVSAPKIDLLVGTVKGKPITREEDKDA